MCSCSPEGQLYPGLYQEKRVQQFECGLLVLREFCPSALLWQDTPGELRPAVEPPAQEGHGAVGAGPEEGHKDSLRAGAPLRRGKAERVGAVQP